ncbi:DUF3572 family protein [Sphingomonas sp.]|jgi:hypothetical protein|uniref:DUF3572 family protein n=1 Tax=Sphingomonas sp. TaxID=28214 RepID=UPI0035C7CAA8
MGRTDTNPDTGPSHAATVALDALVWTLGEPSRAERMMALTGLTPDDLRARIGDASVLAATLAFLEAHEPDLVACAAAIDSTPAALVAARARLEEAA